jgi:hypothetical protein
VRDARIGQIYEGTNYVQALDLVGRKLGEDNGRLLKGYLALVSEELAAARAVPALAPHAATLAAAVQSVERAAGTIARRAATSADEVGASASEFLRLFGLVALGHMWLRLERVAAARVESGGVMRPEFYEAKRAVARYYFDRVMPLSAALSAAIDAGAAPVIDFPTAWF